ncbi:IFT43 isoform 6 [Pan troglodytes]|uniref:IFT43 isoform 8 n=2 Tax=Hominidae TaxID=9604 RepID=A0A2J8W618_PONAB|nr:IFT43 isoform 6 [Pan troglodytes]PNJ65213.1 IFT43 isoform 8 [Pongo abelii]
MEDLLDLDEELRYSLATSSPECELPQNRSITG